MAEDTNLLTFINLWRGRDGAGETSCFNSRADALEEIAATDQRFTYAGTITVPRSGTEAAIENWAEAAHRQVIDASEEKREAEQRRHLREVML